MKRSLKFLLVGVVVFCALPFIPNVLTDRSDRRDVRDNVTAGAKTGASLFGRLAGFLRGEFESNHTTTQLPEEAAKQGTSHKAPTVHVYVNGSQVDKSKTD